MAEILQAGDASGWDGATSPAPPPLIPSGPIMSMSDWATLAKAPQRPVGTTVSVQAKPVFPVSWDFTLPGLGRQTSPDHMFVQFDDPQNSLIARGNPTLSGLNFLTGEIDRSNRLAARVDPAANSPDYNAGYRTLATTFLPNVTAGEAAAGAMQHANGVNQGGNDYGLHINSNSYAADVAQPIFGWRPGDDKTPGYQTHLRDDVPGSIPGSVFTGPLDAETLTPVVQTPPY